MKKIFYQWLVFEEFYISKSVIHSIKVSGNFILSDMSGKLQKYLFYCLIGVALIFVGQVFKTHAQQNENLDQGSQVSEISVDQQPSIAINNSIQAPDLLLARKTATLTADNKGVCSDKHDKPSVSKKKKHNHMDEDCCADFDEWPNPGCAYSVHGLRIMLKRPTPGHVHRH